MRRPGTRSVTSVPTFITRLTWNDANWRKPSGAESKQRKEKTYVATYGFGHEEWLNRREWLLHGWRYAFLQGVHKSRTRLIGKRIRVLLYTIDPSTRKRMYVGELKSAEIIDDEIAQLAVRSLQQRGWLAKMRKEITDAGGNPSGLKPQIAHTIVNVRFAVEDLVMYRHPVQAKSNERILKYHRYALIHAENRDVKEWHERTGRAPREGPWSTAIRVFQLPARLVKADPIEWKMEIEIEELLNRQFGTDSVEAQSDWIDLKVFRPDRVVLIEIKSSMDARTAIRGALGQLLDYAYFGKNEPGELELVIVGRGSPTAGLDRYLQRLRRKFQLNLKYRQYKLGSHRFNL